MPSRKIESSPTPTRKRKRISLTSKNIPETKNLEQSNVLPNQNNYSEEEITLPLSDISCEDTAITPLRGKRKENINYERETKRRRNILGINVSDNESIDENPSQKSTTSKSHSPKKSIRRKSQKPESHQSKNSDELEADILDTFDEEIKVSKSPRSRQSSKSPRSPRTPKSLHSPRGKTPSRSHLFQFSSPEEEKRFEKASQKEIEKLKAYFERIDQKQIHVESQE